MSQNALHPTRRQALAGTAIAAGALAFLPGQAALAADEGISRTGESIHQEVVFDASPARVYQTLTETARFEDVIQLSAAVQSKMALGNKPTKISLLEGGTFTIFGGHIVGRHIELVPNARIVQAWRVVDWDPGVYSIAKFVLLAHDSATNPNMTKLVFDHSAFPAGQAQHLAEGWTGNYWEPIAKYLALPAK
jgi:activator of HSP90 ATPase